MRPSCEKGIEVKYVYDVYDGIKSKPYSRRRMHYNYLQIR